MKAAAIAVCLAVLASLAAPGQARADGGRITAGVLGGLAAGAIIGGAVASSRPPVVYAPAPAYAPPPPPVEYVEPACYWTRGQPVWNGYAWVRPRVQVCD
jgi:hypothetical protein